MQVISFCYPLIMITYNSNWNSWFFIVYKYILFDCYEHKQIYNYTVSLITIDNICAYVNIMWINYLIINVQFINYYVYTFANIQHNVDPYTFNKKVDKLLSIICCNMICYCASYDICVCARIILYCAGIIHYYARMILDCARMILWCARIILECARMIHYCARIILWCARIILECARMILDCARIILKCARIIRDCARIIHYYARSILVLHPMKILYFIMILKCLL